jgi:hypothetical protein
MIPTVTDGQQLQQHLGQTVRLVGTYQQLNVHKRLDRPPTYRGNAYVTLDDGHAVALESLSSVRDAAEIARFEGKRVQVIGTLFGPSYNPSVASLVMPSISDIQSIEPS